VLLPVTSPVIGVASAPLARTVLTHPAIFGIGSDFVPVIISAAFSLALVSAADCLAGLELRWLVDLLAIATTPFTHKGVVSFTAGSSEADRQHLETGLE
jgi:hypothetical protein